jgi:poly-gamma-glutamate synthesis protein (capsule biosynthesis protein)
MLGRTVATTSMKNGGPDYPFAKVSDSLKAADIVLINLENPIIRDCPETSSGLKFCAPPEMVLGLVHAGVDVANIANNHSGNYGRDGVDQTEKYLIDNGIKYVGDGNLEVIEKHGIKFGFLGFNYVDNIPTEADFKLISDSKKKVDVLIVAVHWGIEYTGFPTTIQGLIGRKLAVAGADIIAGTHPHWVQTIDHAEGTPIYYSLGNFVFDQMWSEKTREGLVIKLTYRDSELVNEERLPIYMKNWAQPEFVK